MRIKAAEKAKQTQNIARVLLVATAGNPDEKKHQLRHPARGQGKDPHSREYPTLKKDQCSYCKETGSWAKECP